MGSHTGRDITCDFAKCKGRAEKQCLQAAEQRTSVCVCHVHPYTVSQFQLRTKKDFDGESRLMRRRRAKRCETYNGRDASRRFGRTCYRWSHVGAT